MSEVEAAAVDALEDVEVEAEANSTAASRPGESESTSLDPKSDADPDPGGDRGVTARLFEPMQGSVKQDHIGELWNPEQGGANRLAMVAEEAAGIGDRLPRVAHIPLGVAELYVQNADNLDLFGSAEQSDSEDSEESTRDLSERGGDTEEVVKFDG